MNLRKLGPAALLALVSATPALAQSTTTGSTTGMGSIASVTCADIVALPAAYQAALIYYAAGYRDGQMASTGGAGQSTGSSSSMMDTSSSSMMDTSSSSSMMDTSSSDTGMSSSSAMGSGTDNGLIGGLGLQAQDVVIACGSSGTALLVDVIGNSGGSAGIMIGTSSGAMGSGDMSSSSMDMSSSSGMMDSSSSDLMGSLSSDAMMGTSSSRSAQ